MTFFLLSPLEYCSPLWSLYSISDLRLLENVQKHFAHTAFRKIYRGPYQLNKITKLKIFNRESLEYRKLNFALILCYKVVSGFSDIAISEIFHFASPRGRRAHQLQLARACCSKLFCTDFNFSLYESGIYFLPKSLMHPVSRRNANELLVC